MKHRHVAFACLLALILVAGLMLASDLFRRAEVHVELDDNGAANQTMYVSSAALNLRRTQGTSNDIQLWPVERGGFQIPGNHPWQCGVQGAYRILHTMMEGNIDSFTSMYQKVGSYTFRINWNPCKDLTRHASCKIDYEIPRAKIAVGRIPSDYARVFSSKYASASSTLSLSRDRLEELIRQKKPVIVNMFQGAQKWMDVSVTVPITNKKISVTLHVPLFHYVVVFGFDNTNVHFYNTDNNERRISSWSDFMNGWNWRSCSWNEGRQCAPYDSSVGSIVKSAVEGVGGLTRGAAWWFDSPIYAPTPGCNCDCCGVPGGFCLVPCGCRCKIPETSLYRVKVKNECGVNDIFVGLSYKTLSPEFYNSNYENSWGEGVWVTEGFYRISPGETATIARTQNVNLYFHAHDSITGAEWGDGRKFDLRGSTYDFSPTKIEANLGTSYTYRFTCDRSTYPPPSARLDVKNTCPYAGRIWVLTRYFADGGWRFASAAINYGETDFLAKSDHKEMYYYARSYDNTDIEWELSSGNAYTYSGRTYNMRPISFQDFGKKTFRLGCSGCIPRNCEWSVWSSWGDCDSSADNTLCIQKRSRYQKTKENYCGLPCEGLSEDIRSCQCQMLEQPTPSPPRPRPRPTLRPPTPSNDVWNAYDGYACRVEGSDSGKKGVDFEKYEGSHVNFRWCMFSCEGWSSCQGFEYRYDNEEGIGKCEFWLQYYGNVEKKVVPNYHYCYWKKKSNGGGGGGGGGGNISWKKRSDTACGFGGDGVENKDFLKRSDVSKEWCKNKCLEMGGSCHGYDYAYDKERCRVFYRKTTDNVDKDGVDCWLKADGDNTQDYWVDPIEDDGAGAKPSSQPLSAGDTWKKHDDTACGFGGEGEENKDFIKRTDVSKEWCKNKCLEIGSSCHGYDYDYDKERCRVFYRKTTDNVDKDGVDCWLKQAPSNTVISPNRDGDCASREERSQNCGAGPSQPVSCCEPDRGCDGNRCK